MAETDRSIAQSLSPTASEEGQEEGADPAVSGGDESGREAGPAGRDPETGTRAESEGEDEKKIGEEEEEEEDEEHEEPEAVALQKDEAGEADKENAVAPRPKEQEGGFHDDDAAAGKHGRPESRGNPLSSEAREADRRAEEVKRRRGDPESEELKRMRQETEAELQELRKRREERRKVLEEAEKRKKREMEERKAREEEEKRQMKEGIERRRAEAAEKRQKTDGEAAKPFVCVGPRGSSLKIGDRAEFLNKSAQKSTLKTSHTPTISKIDNRLEQYNTALQREARPSRLALDLPVVTDGIRSLKTRWEEGDVIGNININKESAHVKIAVAELISDWLHRAPETPKSPGGMPADLKPGDVTNKRSLWENMSSAPKTPDGDVSKPVANGKAPV
ncbi:caldesmon, smooth muscle-like isoform X2 [Anguilla rostrata]|uniref:caldesmon, smooth muscle-like isoform X2 n=1 Tax=Anguilla rostrata TaxID=7938 RepID=UPI0030D4D5FA